MYSFPAIITYGLMASVASDTISQRLSAIIKSEPSEPLISGSLHIIFGIILLWYSVGASVLFFVTDRVLQKKRKDYEFLQAVKSLAIPLAVWLLFMGIVWLEHVLHNWETYLV